VLVAGYNKLGGVEDSIGLVVPRTAPRTAAPTKGARAHPKAGRIPRLGGREEDYFAGLVDGVSRFY